MKLSFLKKKVFITSVTGLLVVITPIIAASCTTKESVEEKETKLESSIDDFFELSFKFRNHNSMDLKMMKEYFAKEKINHFDKQKENFLQTLNYFKNDITKEEYIDYLDLINNFLDVAKDINKDIEYIKYLDELLKDISIKINDLNVDAKISLSAKEKEVEKKLIELKSNILKTVDKIPDNIWISLLSMYNIEISQVKNMINSIDLSFFIKKGFKIASEIPSQNLGMYNRTLDNILRITNAIIAFTNSKAIDKISVFLIDFFAKNNN